MSRTSSGPIRYSFDMSTLLDLRAAHRGRDAGAGAGAAATAGAGAGVVAASTAGVAAAAVASAAVVAVTSACDGVSGCVSCACASEATHTPERRRTGRRPIISQPLSRVRPDRPAP